MRFATTLLIAGTLTASAPTIWARTKTEVPAELQRDQVASNKRWGLEVGPPRQGWPFHVRHVTGARFRNVGRWDEPVFGGWRLMRSFSVGRPLVVEAMAQVIAKFPRGRVRLGDATLGGRPELTIDGDLLFSVKPRWGRTFHVVVGVESDGLGLTGEVHRQTAVEAAETPRLSLREQLQLRLRRGAGWRDVLHP